MINFKKIGNSFSAIVLGVLGFCMFVSFEQSQHVEDTGSRQILETYVDVAKDINKDNRNNKENVVAHETPSSKKNSDDVLAKLSAHCHRSEMNEGLNNKNVQKYVRQFRQAKSEKLLVKTSETRSNVDYIVTQVEKRNLPGVLALVPMVESNFKTHARSHCGAVGLWQFMPRTGRAFGLKNRPGYDGRHDVKASTHAALNYLEYLHKKFKGDWMLALAAYNAGEGTVSRAMKRNRLQGKSTSFWSLKLPRETTQYVPKLLGLLQYMKQLD